MRTMLTGHRSGNKLIEPIAFKSMLWLLGELQSYDDDYSPLEVISGGADGADRLWARAANRLSIPYKIFVPRGYKEHYKHGEWFDKMIDGAGSVHWTQKEGVKFRPELNFKRNSDMVDYSERYVVCSYKEPQRLVSEETRGGTRHCTAIILEKCHNVFWIDSITGEVHQGLRVGSAINWSSLSQKIYKMKELGEKYIQGDLIVDRAC